MLIYYFLRFLYDFVLTYQIWVILLHHLCYLIAKQTIQSSSDGKASI